MFATPVAGVKPVKVVHSFTSLQPLHSWNSSPITYKYNVNVSLGVSQRNAVIQENVLSLILDRLV